LHGLSSEISEFAYDPDLDRFVELLCEDDDCPTVIQAAREVANAQFQLNSIRQYKLALHKLKASGRNTPLPASDLLDDPVVRGFFHYIATGEPFDFGVPQKADFRLHQRLVNFIFKQARRKKDPDLERFKLDRYEQMGLRRRLVAIEKLDQLRSELSIGAPLPRSSSVP
jgi:hypothetical protein